MNIETNVPELRFKDFSGGWHEKELSELAEIVRGASPRPIEDPKWFDTQSNVGWLRIRDVTEQDGRIRYLAQRISKLGQEKTRVLHESHLLLSIAASVGKPVINYVETGVHDGFLIFKKPTFQLEFMYQWLKSFELKWQQYGQPGSQVNLNSDIVKGQKINVPAENEQIQIGNTFEKLDSLIEQHQQKHEKLNNIKKAMLEKMFTKPGDTIPEIRFKGFSREWEEVGLLDSIERIIDFRGRTPKKLGLDWSSSGYRALSALNVKQGYIDFSIDPHFGDQELYDKWMSGSELHKGQVLFTTEAPMGNVAQVPNSDKYILSQRTIAFVVKPEVFKEDFLAVLLRSSKIYRELSSLSSGGTAKGVSQKVLAKLNVFVPAELEEQKQIGDYFQKLERLINQHKQQITKLKSIKQACLKKMFV